MTHGNPSSHAWWQDHSDAHQQRALLTSHRTVQRERHVAGWRRNAWLGVLVVAVVVLVRLGGSL